MLRFVPEYHGAIWGGRRLAEAFARTLPDGPIGESWELVDIPGHASRVADGPDAGRALGELWREGRLGGSASGEFPVLLKWLDTHAFLSVQVHPDEGYRAQHGEGDPKTEAWLVAACDPDAVIYRGHRAGLDEAGLRDALASDTVSDWLVEHRPQVGEILHVPAGTLHAIGPGCLLLEVQQPSDTTFRAYDWGRVGLDGRPRELHVEQACRATRFERPGAPEPERQALLTHAFALRLAEAGATVGAPESLRILVAHDGPVQVAGPRGEAALAPGDVLIAEPDDGVLEVAAGPCALVGEGVP